MSWRPDPELDELFPDPADRRVADALRVVQAPEVTADPSYRSQLRRELMQVARQMVAPRMPWWRRLLAPPRVAWGAAAIGAVVLAVAVYSMTLTGPDQTIWVTYNVGVDRPVAAVQPLELTFSQPMDHPSVERALHIEPATAVQYQWVSDTHLRVVPQSGSFAPNTQYNVTLAPNVAQTQQGRPVPVAPAAVFNVAPTPSPAPTPTPTPSPAPTPSFQLRTLAPASDTRPAWSPDGSTLYYLNGDRLLAIDTAAGTEPRVLVPSGVRAFSLSPDGVTIAFTGTGGVATVPARGGPATSVAPGPARALGWQGGRVEYLADGLVVTPAGRPVAVPAALAPGGAAAFSPDGQQLVYAAADALHDLNLVTGRDTAWPGPATLLAWSPDSSRVLYERPDGLWASDPASPPGTRIADFTGVRAADWSGSGRLALVQGGQLQVVGADGGAPAPLAASTATALAWSPAAPALAVVEAGSLRLGQVPTTGIATGPAGVSLADAARVVDDFLSARHAGRAEAAQAMLASGARTLPPLPAGLSRWFTVAAFPAGPNVRTVVRLVFSGRDGRDLSQLDETILVGRGLDGRAVVTSVADSPQRPYGKGPEVLSVAVQSSSLSVQFDSDMNADSLTGACVLRDPTGQAVTAPVTLSGRTASLALPGELPPGTYRLAVLQSAADRDGRAPAAEFDLDVPLGA